MRIKPGLCISSDQRGRWSPQWSLTPPHCGASAGINNAERSEIARPINITRHNTVQNGTRSGEFQDRCLNPFGRIAGKLQASIRSPVFSLTQDFAIVISRGLSSAQSTR